MKNTKLTEMVFILDKSGSMVGLKDDTIGGFNSLLKKQKAKPGRALVTTVLFDSVIEVIHDHVDIQSVPELTRNDYEPGGRTAMLDAIGSTLDRVRKRQDKCDEAVDNTVVAIITDGMENSSREYSHKAVLSMIRNLKHKDWTFIFLGANIDAAEVAEDLGISREMAANYHADGKGTQTNFEGLSVAMDEVRCYGAPSSRWREKIDQDFEKRK